jgi:hypothetical protein
MRIETTTLEGTEVGYEDAERAVCLEPYRWSLAGEWIEGMYVSETHYAIYEPFAWDSRRRGGTQIGVKLDGSDKYTYADLDGAMIPARVADAAKTFMYTLRARGARVLTKETLREFHTRHYGADHACLTCEPVVARPAWMRA